MPFGASRDREVDRVERRFDRAGELYGRFLGDVVGDRRVPLFGDLGLQLGGSCKSWLSLVPRSRLSTKR